MYFKRSLVVESEPSVLAREFQYLVDCPVEFKFSAGGTYGEFKFSCEFCTAEVHSDQGKRYYAICEMRKVFEHVGETIGPQMAAILSE